MNKSEEYLRKLFIFYCSIINKGKSLEDRMYASVTYIGMTVAFIYVHFFLLVIAPFIIDEKLILLFPTVAFVIGFAYVLSSRLEKDDKYLKYLEEYDALPQKEVLRMRLICGSVNFVLFILMPVSALISYDLQH